jgi:hypothetical protein
LVKTQETGYNKEGNERADLEPEAPPPVSAPGKVRIQGLNSLTE